MRMIYVREMVTYSTARIALGATRAAVGLGSWLVPDSTARLFGIDPVTANRFLTRLFGARELALAVALLAAPPGAVRAVAAAGAVIDTVDVIAGLDEARRGNLSTQAILLGAGGALVFAALGSSVACESRSDDG